VLEKQGSFLGMFSLDNRVVIPLKQFISSIWSNPDIGIQVKARALVQLDEAREELRQVMRRVRRIAPNQPDDFSINQQDQFVQMFNRVAGTIALIACSSPPVPVRRRHRHHEHHVRLGRRADARNWHSQGHRRQTPHHPAAISDRSRLHLHDRRVDRLGHCLADDADHPAVPAGDDVVDRRGHRPAGVAGDGRGVRLPAGVARGAHEPGGRVEK